MKAFAAALLGAALALPAPVAGSESIEGRYQSLPTPQPTSNPDKIEVVEIFWYGCPHCNRFRPLVERWLHGAPEHVHFVRMPAIFDNRWELHARAYYTALSLGILDDLHPRLFAAIHDEGRRLATPDAVRSFFLEHGVSPEAFDKHFGSFTVASGVQRSLVMQGRYGIRGVPAVIVNGKYLVSGTTAGSAGDVLRVVDALVAREHAGG